MNATRRNHFSTIFAISFHKKHSQSFKNHFVPYLFPPEGNFDIDAGDGDGGGGGGTI